MLGNLYVFLVIVSYVGAIAGRASVVMITVKRSEAKIITEQCAKAHCSIASQYFTWYTYSCILHFAPYVLSKKIWKSISFPGDGFIRWCDSRTCERGDAYSEAKSITELYALAYSSVASQVSSPGFQLLDPIWKAKLGKHEPDSTLWLPPGRRRIRQRRRS